MIPNYKRMTITLNRTIPASPKEVYDAWLDPATPGTPWDKSECEKVILDAKIDGLYYFKRVSPDGVDFPHFGRFVTLEAATKIAYTWMSPFTHGIESLVTVELERKGEDTLLQLRHSNLPDDELGRLHEAGWADRVDALAERLQARRKR
ncbi:MAG TPA: SRPBCC domain-containing protein [Polyangia bacterium]|nr:SRPBCC domain-containing protein [Polyangia bacterium]